MKIHCLLRAALLIFPPCQVLAAREASGPAPQVHARPNIILILADDLGIGDVHALNPGRGKIPTPHLDELAAQGMAFTDAHGSSAVCTPTRYGLLTGRYNWRSRLQAGVLGLYGDPLIQKDRLTLPAMLKAQGYDTACIGKWHLGWNWPGKGDKADYTRPIGGGPTTLGFDSYFGTDAPNYPPFCFIENDRTVGIPSMPLPKELVSNHKGNHPGPAVPGWNFEAILPTLTDRACDFIRRESAGNEPFFLYFPLTSPHGPIVPGNAWKGKSGLGDYADFVMETDAVVGRVLDALEKGGRAGDTLVVFTSDNGCAPAPYSNMPELEAKGHFPSAPQVRLRSGSLPPFPPSYRP